MKKSDWVWMPHAGHFIGGNFCQFRLNTWVGKFIVSTVGELQLGEEGTFMELGYKRKYETMVFPAKKVKSGCCPYRIKTPREVDFKGYNSASEAYKGHMLLCEKWSRKESE